VAASLSFCDRELASEQQQVEKISPLGELTDEELVMLEEMLAAGRAKLVPELEQNGEGLALEPSDTKQQAQYAARGTSGMTTASNGSLPCLP
jgi:hypothetical protein